MALDPPPMDSALMQTFGDEKSVISHFFLQAPIRAKATIILVLTYWLLPKQSPRKTSGITRKTGKVAKEKPGVGWGGGVVVVVVVCACVRLLYES